VTYARIANNDFGVVRGRHSRLREGSGAATKLGPVPESLDDTMDGRTLENYVDEKAWTRTSAVLKTILYILEIYSIF
jgi:hypothetical protein